MIKALLIGFFLQASVCWGYLPPSNFILSQVAKNNGSKAVQVTQEIVFKKDNLEFLLTEVWNVENSEYMNLTIRGNGLLLTISYRSGRKIFINEQQKDENKALPAEFFENIFYARSINTLGNYLMQTRLVPSDVMRSPPITKIIKNEIKPFKESFVKYARFGGTTNYAITMTPLLEETANQPGVWIEQDKFLIRRLCFPSGLEIIASGHREFVKGLYFPLEREVKFNGQTVFIKTTQVRELDARTRQGALELKPLQYPSSEFADLIRDFYLRYR
jgi:hypothetical protein